MRLFQLELRLHKLIYPTAQGDVGVTEHIGIDRVHGASDFEALAFELLVSRDGVAVVGLG